MAWEGSTRKSRLPADWPKIRLRIGSRDGWKCMWRLRGGGVCGKHANQVDHIVPNDDHSDANLQMLCEEHHKIKSSREGGRASYAELKARKKAVARPPEAVTMKTPTQKPRHIGF